MNRRPAVSFITCVRNQSERFFYECARSVAQQPRHIEWVIVDDASTPECQALQRQIVTSVNSGMHTAYVCLPEAQGLSQARNAGLAVARGEWVVCLDSDDRVSVGLVDLLVGLPSTAQMACFEVRYFDDVSVEHRKIERFEALFRQYAGRSLDPFLWYDFYYHGIIARRSLLRQIAGYRPDLRVGEDQDILLRATSVLSPEEVAFVHQTGYEYRRNPNGVCARLWDEVARNYTDTMLLGAHSRGVPFKACRFGGVEALDGAQVDYYEYLFTLGRWVTWHDWRRWLEE